MCASTSGATGEELNAALRCAAMRRNEAKMAMPITSRPKCPQKGLRGNQVGRRSAYRLPVLIAGYCDWAAKILARWQLAHLLSTARGNTRHYRLSAARRRDMINRSYASDQPLGRRGGWRLSGPAFLTTARPKACRPNCPEPSSRRDDFRNPHTITTTNTDHHPRCQPRATA